MTETQSDVRRAVLDKVEFVAVGTLNPAPYNPRKWTERQKAVLKESMRKFGMVEPILVNKNENRKNVVIGGHFRLACAKELGYAEVPVVFIDIADIALEKELNIRLNKNVADWDWGMLGEFDESFLVDLGFKYEDIGKITGAVEAEQFEHSRDEEMELKSFESYDYVVLVFRNTYDWLNAQQELGLKDVNYSFITSKKVGLGRVIDGKVLLERLQRKDRDNQSGKK